ncbi:MAG TPA: cyclic pyranopterin monophosphate synthase MoaC [Candidatus Thermoplasmatota archaeon]|nr:cyclic pyranopterin monophosphate synthase MoaC [Candidatus Thermoplasmatota archaeon]
MAPGARIVDVGSKPIQQREAEARGLLTLQPATLQAIRDGKVAKGDVVAVAQAAGLLAVKRTPDLLPLCHPIPLAGAEVHLALLEGAIEARCVVRAAHTTGVEMDALTGCAVALLTVWDMVKSLEKDARGQYPTTALQELRVVRKVKQ